MSVCVCGYVRVRMHTGMRPSACICVCVYIIYNEIVLDLGYSICRANIIGADIIDVLYLIFVDFQYQK